MKRRWNDTINWVAVLAWGSMFGFWIGFLVFLKEYVS